MDAFRGDDPDLRDGGSPLAVQFDRGVALTGYGLLFTSLFTAGLTSLAAYVLASAHRHDSHLVVRTHYRYQMQLVRTSVLSLILAILCGLVALLLGVAKVFGWAELNIPWATSVVGVISLPAHRLEAAGWFVVGALVLLAYGALHTGFGCVWGVIKLVTGRPIGDIDWDD